MRIYLIKMSLACLYRFIHGYFLFLTCFCLSLILYFICLLSHVSVNELQCLSYYIWIFYMISYFFIKISYFENHTHNPIRCLYILKNLTYGIHIRTTHNSIYLHSKHYNSIHHFHISLINLPHHPTQNTPLPTHTHPHTPYNICITQQWRDVLT